MGEVIANRKPLEEKHFLMRALNCKNITQEEYDEKVKELDKEITKNLQEVLAEENAKLKDEALHIKQTIYNDGDFKRGVAKVLIKFLEPMFIETEIRGIMRQGYKIMRRKIGGD